MSSPSSRIDGAARDRDTARFIEQAVSRCTASRSSSTTIGANQRHRKSRAGIVRRSRCSELAAPSRAADRARRQSGRGGSRCRALRDHRRSSPAALSSSCSPWPSGSDDGSNPGPSSSTIDLQAFVRARAHERRPSAPRARDGHRVFDAVLDQGLQRQARHQRRAVPGRRSRSGTGAFAESHALDLQIAPDRGEFLVEGDEREARRSSDDRMSEASCSMTRSADAGLSRTRAAIEFSVLKRKCGSTRASSEASCASAASRRASASSRSFVRSATVVVAEARAEFLHRSCRSTRRSA